MPTPINRESIVTNLETRYAKQKAGGAFDAYAATTNTMILGAQAPFGFTQKSLQYTIQPGFTTGLYIPNTGNAPSLRISDLLLENNTITLMPENPDFAPLVISKEMEFVLWGVVTNVIHPV